MEQTLDDSLLEMNLQYFADGDGDTTQGDDPNGNDGKEPDANDAGNDNNEDDNNSPKPEFTQEQVNQMIADRLKREREAIAQKQDEDAKLRKMNADQKRDYELDKLQKENQALKAAQLHADLKSEANKQLASAGVGNVPDGVLELVTKDSAEETSKAIQQLVDWHKAIHDSAQNEVLKGNTPSVLGGKATAAVDKTQFDAMTLEQRTKLAKENPALFSKFTGGM